jgi:hypothetical protein
MSCVIRNKIRARGDQLYAEAIGRQNGRRCRRMIARNFIMICVVTAILCVLFLVPEFGVIENKLVLFKDKLKARLSGSTEYIKDGEGSASSRAFEPSTAGDP